VGRGSAVNFGADSVLYLAWLAMLACLGVRILGVKQKLDHGSFLALVGKLLSSSKLFLFSNKAYLLFV